MFDNGIFGFFKSSNKEESAQEQTWNPSTMTMEQPQNYAASAQTTEQPMKLRGGGEGGFCCGICAGLLCFECCEDCC